MPLRSAGLFAWASKAAGSQALWRQESHVVGKLVLEVTLIWNQRVQRSLIL